VQRGPLDGRARQQHRVEVGDRGDGPRASDLEIDAFDACEGLLGLEFIGYRPLGRLGGETQRPPHGEAVYLDDHTIGGEGKPLAGLVPEADVVVHLARAAADAHGVRNLESPLPGFYEALPMGLERQVLARQLVERAVQSAAGHHRRGLLLERPGRGVARIGERRLAVLFALGVEAVERSIRQQDFAPDLEELGPVVAPQSQRHRADRPHVGRHVVAPGAVAAREGLYQQAVFVGERDGRAVEFEFGDQLRFARFALDAGDEFVQLVERIGVAQREHREAVFHAPELGGRVAAHPQRRRRGVGPFGMLGLQPLQLAHQGVELEIGYFGVVFNVIFVVVVVEFTA
jgi:hypothetical protein